MLDELLAALAPFAKLGERLGATLNADGARDDCPLPNSGELTMGDLRRLLDAYAKAKGEL